MVSTLLEKHPQLFIKEYLRSVEPGQFVYVHPSKKEDLAFFGVSRGSKELKIREDNLEECFLMKVFLEFSYNPHFELWIPSNSFSKKMSDKLAIDFSSFYAQDCSLYEGLERISDAMRTHANPNESLVTAVYNMYKKHDF